MDFADAATQRPTGHVTESSVEVCVAIRPPGGTSRYYRPAVALCGLHTSRPKMAAFVSRHRYVTLRRRDASPSYSTKASVGLTDLQA